ncbi:MAG: HdeD family acid-resistance protein [Xanthobacteraceae bacterium]
MSTNQAANAGDMRRALANAIHEHWGIFLAEGILLVILGFIAILVPVLATLWFTLVVGWLFLISGVVGLFTTFRMRHAPGFWWSLLSGILGVAAGIVLLVWTASGALSLTLLLSAFFIVEGVASIMYAIDHRNQLTGRWGWMLLSGVIDLILAAIILLWLRNQDTAFVPLGLLIGINMLFGGTAMIGMALAARHPA